MKQDISYWNSPNSIKRYAYNKTLFDIEKIFLLEATERLDKSPKNIKVLDIGCGGGRTTKAMLNLGYDVIGLDIAPNLIADLQKKIGKNRAVVGNAAKLIFKKSSFDIAVFSHNGIDYLYPLKNREKGLDEINRILKPGGYFIFSSHIFQKLPFNKHTLAIVLQNWYKLFTLQRNGYYQEYVDDTLVETYSASKLEVIKQQLEKSGFSLIRHSSFVSLDDKVLTSYLKALLSWERYYLAVKK